MKIAKGTFLTLRDKGIYLYDPSRMSTFIACPLAYNYRHEMGLVPMTDEPSYSLSFGACGHTGLQTWEQSNRDDQIAMKATSQKFIPLQEPTQYSAKTGKELKGTYTVLNLMSLLTAYFTKYRSDPRQLVDVELCLAEEVDTDMFVCGRIDRLIKGRSGYTFTDYKFTKYPNNYDPLPSLQFQTYEWLIRKLTQSKVSGELDILQVMKSYGTDDPISRVPFSYSDFHREEWRQSVIQLIKNITVCRNERHWPMTWNCKPFFSDCAYKPLCQAPSSDSRKGLIANLYKVEYWDPFDAV